MESKKQAILDLVAEYIKEKRASKTWTAGKDWVQISGPYFDHAEFVNGVDTLLDECFILGHKGREFELQFAHHSGKQDGILVNSG